MCWPIKKRHPVYSDQLSSGSSNKTGFVVVFPQVRNLTEEVHSLKEEFSKLTKLAGCSGGPAADPGTHRGGETPQHEKSQPEAQPASCCGEQQWASWLAGWLAICLHTNKTHNYFLYCNMLSMHLYGRPGNYCNSIHVHTM